MGNWKLSRGIFRVIPGGLHHQLQFACNYWPGQCTRGRGEVLGQAGVAKASAYHHNRSIKESKK